MDLDLITPIFGGGSPSGRKKTYRYRVTVKGVTISRHFTKSAAVKAAKGKRGARVVAISSRRSRSFTKRRRRY